MRFLELASEHQLGFLIVVLVVLASVFSQRWVRKKIGPQELKDLHEVGGIYLSAVGTLYSVILGLILVDASGKFSEAKQNVDHEADWLLRTYALAGQMPKKNAEQIQSSMRAYVDEVIEHGFALMAEGKSSQKAADLYVNLVLSIRSVEPVTENQKAVYPALLETFLNSSEGRSGRLNFSDYSMPDIEWLSLIVGGAVTIGFTFLFAVKSDRIQSIMTGLVALMVSLNLYLVFMFDQPFSGELKVAPDRFVHLKQRISVEGDLYSRELKQAKGKAW